MSAPRPVVSSWSGDDTDTALCRAAMSPTDPRCLAAATHHGMKTTSLACHSVPLCPAHVSVMRSAFDYVHVMGSACDLPGSQFVKPLNLCRMPGLDTQSLMGWAEVSA